MISVRLQNSSVYLVVFLFVVTPLAIASTPMSDLLALISGDSQVVAGIDDSLHERTPGHLLFVTHQNGVDYDDWLALIGVDPTIGVNSLIEVAASSSRGELKERLLLAKGTFNRASIFGAAEQNGAVRATYKGEEVLLIEPFAREQTQVKDTRWLAIIDGRFSIFGTPNLVQQALDRRAAHSDTDPRLVARLAQLGPDMKSWAVLKMPPSIFAQHLDSEELNTTWKELLANTDELSIGIRSGPQVQLNFAIHTTRPFLPPGSIAESTRSRLLRTGLNQISRLRLRTMEVQDQQLSGSIVIPEEALDGVLSEIFGMRRR